MRAKNGAARNRAKKRFFQAVEGFVGRAPPPAESAKETLLRAGMFAFRDRRAKKREFRRLFIIRLTAAAEMRGLRYSRLIHGLRLAKIGLDRKSLSELAIHDPETFDAIVAMVREQARQARRGRPRPPEGQDGLSPDHGRRSLAAVGRRPDRVSGPVARLVPRRRRLHRRRP